MASVACKFELRRLYATLLPTFVLALVGSLDGPFLHGAVRVSHVVLRQCLIDVS